MAAASLVALFQFPAEFILPRARRAPTRPQAVLNNKTDIQQRMLVPYELQRGQSRVFHQLPSGLNLEVIEQKRSFGTDDNDSNGAQIENPPLVFVHGSYHAAWCWAEHWLPFFASSGFDCYALSLLGQGESDAPGGSVAGTLQTHAGDVADFIQKNIKVPPVILGHSFGGLIIQYYLANTRIGKSSDTKQLYPQLAGAVLICSVPPSGNSGLVWRYLFSKPLAAFKVTRSLAAKAFQTDLSLCKETFFSPMMEDNIVKRYQELLKESSQMPLFDLRKLNASLPVPAPPEKSSSANVLVLGASGDFIVDGQGLNETASFYGVSPARVEGVAHDMMLDCEWDKGARVILSWLNARN
ncbi:unnamed protein product [Linum tenue]|uniref:AB hydrolase-1 domain-containing protein n=1 Tax=Linum tenue TaxID=586396 RepID=A0AAV0MYI9_9ROSI|nr:unnamed protein product [Linum tenue]CAI0451387.1 unnamed protein product [Linum tenue]